MAGDKVVVRNADGEVAAERPSEQAFQLFDMPAFLGKSRYFGVHLSAKTMRFDVSKDDLKTIKKFLNWIMDQGIIKAGPQGLRWLKLYAIRTALLGMAFLVGTLADVWHNPRGLPAFAWICPGIFLVSDLIVSGLNSARKEKLGNWGWMKSILFGLGFIGAGIATRLGAFADQANNSRFLFVCGLSGIYIIGIGIYLWRRYRRIKKLTPKNSTMSRFHP